MFQSLKYGEFKPVAHGQLPLLHHVILLSRPPLRRHLVVTHLIRKHGKVILNSNLFGKTNACGGGSFLSFSFTDCSKSWTKLCPAGLMLLFLGIGSSKKNYSRTVSHNLRKTLFLTFSWHLFLLVLVRDQILPNLVGLGLRLLVGLREKIY